VPKIRALPATLGAWFHAAVLAALFAFGAYFDLAVSAGEATPLPPRNQEFAMTKKSSKDDTAPKAKHGAPSEVTWEGGSGRQPYVNQQSRDGDAADLPPSHSGEFAEGDRGELSGRNLEQLEKVRKVP
jgi:hypothetical protein